MRLRSSPAATVQPLQRSTCLARWYGTPPMYTCSCPSFVFVILAQWGIGGVTRRAA